MPNNIQIKIENGVAEVTTTENLASLTKKVTIENLVNSLSKETMVKSEVLPFGCRFYATSGIRYHIGVEYTPCSRPMILKNNDGKVIFSGVVPLPGFFSYYILMKDNGKYVLQNMYLHALKGPILNPERTNVYKVPFPNVYPDGHICFGSVTNGTSVNRFNRLIEVGSVFDRYISSGFNTDLLGRSYTEYGGFEGFLRAVEGMPSFPYNELQNSDHENLQKLINTLSSVN